jgi:hypothetical protein
MAQRFKYEVRPEPERNADYSREIDRIANELGDAGWELRMIAAGMLVFVHAIDEPMVPKPCDVLPVAE